MFKKLSRSSWAMLLVGTCSLSIFIYGIYENWKDVGVYFLQCAGLALCFVGIGFLAQARKSELAARDEGQPGE